MKTPVTKKIIQDHFSYAWWKYALVVVISIMGWSIIYSMTAYRAPEEKKIVMGVYTYGNESNINAYMEAVRADLFPDMEEMNAMYIMPDDAYGDMILQTRIAARECDIYVLPRSQFQGFAAQGGFMPLNEALPELVADLEAAGVSMSRGWRTVDETGERNLYAIPCADLPGIQPMLQCDTSDMYMSIFFETGNNDNVVAFFEKFVRDMMAEPIVE